MWYILTQILAPFIVGIAAGYFGSGGRVKFLRGATRQREECPGCGNVGEPTLGSRGDAEIYNCKTCRVLEYRVFPYNVNW